MLSFLTVSPQPLCTITERACACVTESTLIHFPATAIKYNDLQGPPSKFAVAMVTVSGFEQVVLGNIILKDISISPGLANPVTSHRHTLSVNFTTP